MRKTKFKTWLKKHEKSRNQHIKENISRYPVPQQGFIKYKKTIVGTPNRNNWLDSYNKEFILPGNHDDDKYLTQNDYN